jgi:hypothetical protein
MQSTMEKRPEFQGDYSAAVQKEIKDYNAKSGS